MGSQGDRQGALYSDINSVSPEEMEYRVGGNFMNDCTRYWGDIYKEGTFGFSGDVLLAGSGTTDFQSGRAVKGTLGEVYVVCAVPGTEDEDYILYFFSAEIRQEDIAKPFSEIEFNLETADYIFPDVRENNVSILQGQSAQGAVAFLQEKDNVEPLCFIGFENVVKMCR